MDFETYVKIHEDDSPGGLLEQLVETLELLGYNRVNCNDAVWLLNHDDAEYFSRECKYMMRRADWLYEKLLKILEDKNCNADI